MCMLLMGCGRAAGSFSPADYPGLQLWLESDYGLYQERTGASASTPASSDSDPMGTWLDQSGQDNHFTAPADSKRPIIKLAILNGLPVVRFDGVDDFLSIADPFALTDLTFFAVVRYQTVTSGDFLLAKWNNDSNQVAFQWGLDSSNSKMLLSKTADGDGGGATNETKHSDTTDAAETWYLHAAKYTDSSKEVVFYRNGAADGSATYTNAGIYDDSRPLILGARELTTGNFDQLLHGDLAAILVYDSALPDANREAVESYLNSKYGIY